MRISRAALALICAVYVGLSAGSDRLNAASATTAPNFPLIFYPPGTEAQAGLLHEGRKKTFETGCYHFGEGGAVNISISADFWLFMCNKASRAAACAWR